MSIRIVQYDSTWRERWDRFVRGSRNGTFLFLRDYMEYHADRFSDNSLLFLSDDKLVALFPANRDGTQLVSHGGLTFGGLLTMPEARTPNVLEMFDALREYARLEEMSAIIYKSAPHIYHRYPAEDDLYALYRHDARLIRRDISSSMRPAARLPLAQLRKRRLNRARKHGGSVQRELDVCPFMDLVADNLSRRHGTRPTHTAEEMQALADRFPQYIKLHVARRDETLLAGVIVYESEMVAHAQYIASSDEGREAGSLDLVIESLLNVEYRDKPCFDFGISTEDSGRCLNAGLIGHKESFGARAIAYDWYQLDAA